MSDILVDALANARRPKLNRRQYRGIPSAITAGEPDIRSILEAVRENIERLQREMDVLLLTGITITDLTKLIHAGAPIINTDQATDLARQKDIETAPLQQ